MFACSHLVSSEMERPGQLSVQMTECRNCLSPLCTANDKKINTGNGKPKLPAIRSPSHMHTHTNTHCAADYIMLCVCTVKAAAVTRRDYWRDRHKDFVVWSKV